MKVAAIHHISDKEGFYNAVSKATEAGLPEGFDLPYQYAAVDGKTHICIWEAPSSEAVSEIVEGIVGPFAKNEVMEVRPA
jgi:hypothetical protein